MSWITIIWAMIASACLTLARVHLVIWFQQTWRRAHLLFSVTAISVAAIAACELLLMRARTTEQFGTVLLFGHRGGDGLRTEPGRVARGAVVG